MLLERHSLGERTAGTISRQKRGVKTRATIDTCRTKIVVPEPDGLIVKNAILRVSGKTGRAAAKCPRCKNWVEVPLNYRE